MLITNVLESPRYRPIFELAVAAHINNSPLLIADVTRKLGRTASSVHDQVKRLEAEGLFRLEGEARRARHIVLAEKGLAAADLQPRELVSTATATPASGFEFDQVVVVARCGPPLFTAGAVTPLSIAHLFPQFRDGDRVILADNYSMVDPTDESESIYPGDLAWGRDSILPPNGQNAYVEYTVQTGENSETECNIKQFSLNEQTGMVTLRSRNPQFPDSIRPLEDLKVISAILDVRRLMGTKK